ncbi:ABC transporter permease [Blastococcus litoris]|uniref:ABC transporter permease n=1 Tax=Blastococcus litoris TaxID=2171622 RepID=UPI000E301444|nr:ABC transporter permease [Blastococcus litoris]
MTQSLREVWQYRGLIGNFARREIKGKYKGSLLGSAWSLINPLATLATYSLVFGFILRFPTPVAGNGSLTSFPIYLFTALVVWNFFHSVTMSSIGALVGAGPLLRKIHFPPFAPVLGSAIAVLQQTAIEFGLLFVVYVIVWNISWTILLVPVLLLLLSGFALGLGMLLAIFNAWFRDVNYIVTVLLGLLFYASPIIYPITLVTDLYDEHPWLRIYEFNPITAFVEAFRDVLWDLEFPGWGRLGYLVLVSAIVLAVGWSFFQRKAADVSEEL